MKNLTNRIVSLFIAIFLLTGCSVVEGIFKTGMGFGIFLSLAALVIIVYIFTQSKKKG